MTEGQPRNLISEAFDKQAAKRREAASIEEAKGRTPELIDLIDSLVADVPEVKRVHFPNHYVTKNKAFWVPSVVPDDEPLEIVVVRSKITQYDTDLERKVDIQGVDEILVITNNSAILESREHRIRTFDINTPIGPGSNSDLGPVRRRQINMSDFESYSAVLERLTQPDVTVKTSPKT